MALMKVSEYRRMFTRESRPDPRTVRAWVAKGTLYGEKRGRDLYVDPSRDPRPPPPPPQRMSPLARKVLSE